jgi:hypothetical protein
LARIEQRLAPLDRDETPIQLVVGPLDVAIPIALRVGANTDGRELAVLTDEIELRGIPTWQLAESSRDLATRLQHWHGDARRGVGVIEADGAAWDETGTVQPLTPRLLHTIDRVRNGNVVGLVRLALRGLPPVADLHEALATLGGSCVIDLAVAPHPDQLLEAVNARLPIATITGRPVTAPLVMALRAR